MVSIIDVAKQANVSISTVSRVLSGSTHPVSEGTRARVLAAADALDYSPSALAQAMVTQATHIVGVIIGDATDPYFAAITRGVEDVAREHGYLVILCNSDRIPEIELGYLNTLASYRVDGIIFAGGGLTDEAYLQKISLALKSYQGRGAGCVSLAKHLHSTFSVMVDNEQVIKDAMAYLIGLGHRSIAYVSGPGSLTTTTLRLNGYLSALEDHRIKFRPELVFDGDYNYESGLRVAKAIDTLSEQPTALLASNDIMAIGCIVGLKELGYRIPEEISVVGIDDIATAQVVDPPLTTVSLPLYDLGATGMESLIKLRRGEIENDGVITLPHHLILRRSAASPAAYTAVE